MGETPRLRIMARVFVSTVAALTLGTGSAVIGARVAERVNSVPEYKDGGERFDLTTFSGRFAKMLSNNDPSTLLTSSDSVLAAQSLLEKGNIADRSDQELWGLKKTTESAVHPDTRELIPLPFRMAGYVPFNGPICAAMMATTSTGGLLFWNWVNQSQNALINYFNRNASSEMSNKDLLSSYAGAVTAALSVAFGLNLLIRRSFAPETATRLMKFIAFPSSMVASSSNCYIMRRSEITKGIELLDEQGNTLEEGKRSVAAATKAVYETVFSRCMLQIPVFFMPALIMSLPPVTRLVKRKGWVSIPLMSFVTIVCFSFGLPAAIAIFPQQGRIKVSDLEEEFRHLQTEHTEVLYNKGL